ncbi:hypothetical protein BBAG_0139 [Bifidobacterium angulatum DSM 20098 = JCM 7096]|nr:hypothetical protein BBAG_0139 [Bifidobacterium angulatum DSM 20098 = JCM 7096]
MGTQSRAQRRSRVGLAGLNLELEKRRYFLFFSHSYGLLSITRYIRSPLRCLPCGVTLQQSPPATYIAVLC